MEVTWNATIRNVNVVRCVGQECCPFFGSVERDEQWAGDTSCIDIMAFAVNEDRGLADGHIRLKTGTGEVIGSDEHIVGIAHRALRVGGRTIRHGLVDGTLGGYFCVCNTAEHQHREDH